MPVDIRENGYILDGINYRERLRALFCCLLGDSTMDLFSPEQFDVFTEDETDSHVNQNLPKPITLHRQTQRQFIKIAKTESLQDVLPKLPPPGTDIWIISNGDGSWPNGKDPAAFEFGHFVPVLAGLLGGQTTCYLSTWSMNQDHADALLTAIDVGLIEHFVILTDRSFQGRKSSIANSLIEGLRKRGQTYLTFHNHAKILAMISADGLRTCVVFGSANLSQQPRAENYTLTTDPAAYQFVASQFFEAMIHARKNR